MRKSNTQKSNMIKPTVLLVVSVILVISVCFSSAHAWFLKQASSKADITGETVRFYFTTNGKFNQDITLTPTDGASADNTHFRYVNEPKSGMFPGQQIRVALNLSNKNSDLDAIYKVSIKDIVNLPPDCYIKAEWKSVNKAVYRTYLNGDKVLFPSEATEEHYLYADDTAYAYLPAGQSQQLTFTIAWMYSLQDIDSTIRNDCVYKSDEEKNAGDMAYLTANQDENGNMVNNFSLKFNIYAEQVNK